MLGTTYHFFAIFFFIVYLFPKHRQRFVQKIINWIYFTIMMIRAMFIKSAAYILDS